MRVNSLLILATATAIAVAGATWAVIDREQRTAAASAPDSLFPGLIDRVNDVARVDVQTASLKFSIVRGEDGTWTVPEKGGYPVRFETIKQAVVGIAGMKPLEPRTAKPELYAKLQVGSPVEGGRGTLLRLHGSDGKEIAAVVVGKTRSVGSSSRPAWIYVRKAGEAGSWLAETRLETWDQISRWLDSTMPTLNRKRVRSVHTVKPDGEEISISRSDPDARDFTVDDIPPGYKMLHATAANTLSSAVGFLNFDDVRPAAEIDLTDATVAEFTTFDGLVLQVRIARVDGKFWARFATRFEPAAVQLDGLSEDQRKELKSAEQVGAEVADVNSRFGGWVYNLPDYKGTDFMIGRSGLIVEDKPAAKPAN